MTTKERYFLELGSLGYIEGSTIKAETSGQILCHYFGGVPYALPPVGLYRWRKPRPLPDHYRYGTRANPGVYTGATSICPQQAPLTQPDPTVVGEDCLQTNLWLPAGDPPKDGWPVYFYIHGGSLQFGNPNELEYAELLGDTDFKAIIVAPADRLNVFGFLASRELQEEAESNGEPLGNYGFWDQRLCLEWAHDNIRAFGGDPGNITVAGYSAGAHSVFHQLAYDLGLDESQAIVRRAVMHSNSCGMQPKYVDEAQEQFEELVAELGIPATLSAREKLARLRATDAAALVAANMRMRLHEVRSVSDGRFVRAGLFDEVEDGRLARRLRARGVRLWAGECRDEHFVYRVLRPPPAGAGDSLDVLRARMLAEYPRAATDALLALYFPDRALPPHLSSWIPDAYGRVFADLQVHMLQRGFLACLVNGGAADLIYRYRIEWRAEETDAKTPREWGVTHGTDNSIWVYGEGRGLLPHEKESVKSAFLDLYARFVKGEDIRSDWGMKTPLEVRRLKPDGTVGIWTDDM